MKLPHQWDREYRLLALAVAFFLVGLFFFLHDSPSPASSAPSAVPVKPAVSVQPVSPAEQVQPTGSG
ncbi:MAG: hypothetical protein WCF77_04130, partial [Minisyncoccia bacterium]